jgi:Inositol 1,3,4-trisphosphate 5/6-kinase ATP-grasp domain
MQVVLDDSGLGSVSIPGPLCVQEYIDHSALLHKVYMMGSKVWQAAQECCPNHHRFRSPCWSGLKRGPIALLSIEST